MMIVLHLFTPATSRDLEIHSSRGSLIANSLCVFIYVCVNTRMVTLFLWYIGTEQERRKMIKVFFVHLCFQYLQ